ncbi:hypothetical protein, partial [Roseobacter litoralis]|uniref:hypothetical protein n=1 Tax=Roseobacter litoralis TaxID=42443 RepID=UPI002493F4EA
RQCRASGFVPEPKAVIAISRCARLLHKIAASAKFAPPHGGEKNSHYYVAQRRHCRQLTGRG